MQDGGGQVECGFGVWSEERPRLPRVLIGPQRHMESRFYICGSAVHIQDQAIRMGRGHRQAVGRCELGKRRIVLDGWPKLFGELSRCEKVAVARAGRIIKVSEQACERIWIARWQTDGQLQVLGGGQMLDRLQGCHGRWHVAMQLLAAGGRWRHGGQAEETHDDGDDSNSRRNPMA